MGAPLAVHGKRWELRTHAYGDSCDPMRRMHAGRTRVLAQPWEGHGEDPWSSIRMSMERPTRIHGGAQAGVCTGIPPPTSFMGSIHGHAHACVRCLDRARMCLPMAAYDASLVHVRAFVVPRTTFVGPRTCLRGAAYDASLVHVCAFVVPRTSFVGPRKSLRSAAYELRGST